MSLGASTAWLLHLDGSSPLAFQAGNPGPVTATFSRGLTLPGLHPVLWTGRTTGQASTHPAQGVLGGWLARWSRWVGVGFCVLRRRTESYGLGSRSRGERMVVPARSSPPGTRESILPTCPPSALPCLRPGLDPSPTLPVLPCLCPAGGVFLGQTPAFGDGLSSPLPAPRRCWRPLRDAPFCPEPPRGETEPCAEVHSPAQPRARGPTRGAAGSCACLPHLPGPSSSLDAESEGSASGSVPRAPLSRASGAPET